jgi:hypothetical protein
MTNLRFDKKRRLSFLSSSARRTRIIVSESSIGSTGKISGAVSTDLHPDLRPQSLTDESAARATRRVPPPHI